MHSWPHVSSVKRSIGKQGEKLEHKLNKEFFHLFYLFESNLLWLELFKLNFFILCAGVCVYSNVYFVWECYIKIDRYVDERYL